MKKKNIQILLFLGILASLIVGLGEYMLHYLPGGPDGEMAMLDSVPLERASKGHFLVVFGAPLYLGAYYGLMNIFRSVNPKLSIALFIAGVLSFMVGGVWVGSRYFAAEVLQRSAGTDDYSFYLQSYLNHYQVLVWALRVFILSVSVIFILLILNNKVGLPKWLVIFNPIVILLLIFSTLSWCFPLGKHIAPVAMNATHFIFFIVLLWQLKKYKLFKKS